MCSYNKRPLQRGKNLKYITDLSLSHQESGSFDNAGAWRQLMNII